jgi:catechol 2,3-dioxygenase-like lactoylglutathione lyase family enzyme
MAIHFNHTILPARDSKASADFLGEMLGLPAPRRWGPFHMVTTDNDANLDYMDTEEKVVRQHYAFLVDDAEFEQIFNRIRERNLPYWADPGQRKPGETNDHDGGRGLYFEDRTGICSKSSRVRTAAAAGIRERRAKGAGPMAITAVEPSQSEESVCHSWRD